MTGYRVPLRTRYHFFNIFVKVVKVHGTFGTFTPNSQYNDQQGNASNTPFCKSMNGREGGKRALKRGEL